MAFGNVTRKIVGTVDVVAPGDVVIETAQQTSNTNIKVTGFNPGVDSDGTALTGLKNRTGGITTLVDGIDPTEGLNMDQCLALPGVVSIKTNLSETDAGQPFEDNFTISAVGPTYVVFYAANDETVQ